MRDYTTSQFIEHFRDQIGYNVHYNSHNDTTDIGFTMNNKFRHMFTVKHESNMIDCYNGIKNSPFMTVHPYDMIEINGGIYLPIINTFHNRVFEQ